ncbi:1-deoxy-D-xylulose-5-phosphate reductoisomerase [Rhodobacterales bacterium 52_120_T64]|nr:1-deoxy-D-xylulose-5-phosphate reductoisomerase [Rhodobacterales bacterium 52_120_T64]
MRRTVSIFGSTGSIGCNTVELLLLQGGAKIYDVKVVTGARNIQLLAEQAVLLNADMAVTADESRLETLIEALAGTGIVATAGSEALRDAAMTKVDWVMSAIVGSAGLTPTLEMAKQASVLALANKESLVCAGELIKATCAKSGCMLVPVDSEHCAIYQALAGGKQGDISRIILTASGGPFLDWTPEQMANATLEQAMAHPNWDMGQRISIDSATMFNKALEVIEAHQLFDVSATQIEVVVHPQSIVHSMIEYNDYSVIAQLAAPDMRGAIGFALNWPERQPLPIEQLDFGTMSRLDFATPDEIRFPALRLARRVLEIGGLAGAVFNAAKESALDRFISGDIGFLDMARLVETVLENLHVKAGQSSSLDGLEAVMTFDREARTMGQNWMPK